MKGSSMSLPDMCRKRFPVRIDSEHPKGWCPPEFWITIPTENLQKLVKELEKHRLEYIIYGNPDSFPQKSVTACRSGNYKDTADKIIEICQMLHISDFVVSDGGLSYVDVDGDLQGFICFE